MQTQETLQPTIKSERILAMDTIRGISLFGILLMNIIVFGLYKAYFDPTNNGGATGWNLTFWWMNTLFFEGTMRGMFSMLFGAGILLFTSRSVENKQGTVVTDLFFRRLMWMVLFGVIHCYLLLWDGDILYTYGIVGMFAFSFRHLAPKYLILASAIILIVAAAFNVKDYFKIKDAFGKVTIAQTKKTTGENLVKEDSTAIEKWNAILKEEKATPTQVKEEMTARSKGYWSIVMHKLPVNQYMETTFLYFLNFWDTLAMMLWGMAFFKLGILKAAKSNRFYWLMALMGYGIGITINYFEGSHIVSSNFSILSIYKTFMTYNLGRIPTTCGHIALIMLFVKSGFLPFLQKSLAAVGQMAFTNYITHSIICNFIFLGYGFSMYGKLQRYELYYIVISIWVFQLIVSPIWLKYFRFGPLEWLWRSLTYWKLQPMKR
ncbi:DUF418 domain-containing protein [Runella salmonicolor]|uniref:DUF418 domain-containing protein n=1 Tax=Runella salmonicolor TaxID=2950278 RepID=A0ABT1FIQ2_9BACT|nr:DUF418 domain-containing protein [Runella salmonicolor]MCP1381646.1 DUF418 domain-containing protein [Runella salmonicolor]